MADAGLEPNRWYPFDDGTARLHFDGLDGSQATWGQVIEALGTDQGRAHWNAMLASCPFTRGFFWEMPPLCLSTRDVPFEMCAVRAAPEQVARWDARLDRGIFEQVGRGADAVVFNSLNPHTRRTTNTVLVAPGDMLGSTFLVKRLLASRSCILYFKIFFSRAYIMTMMQYV